jgi:glycine/D-amino acid oxidase-like deaminating enzyme
VEQVCGFILCAGFSGHGFKLGPAIGELMAEGVTDGKASSIDISRFSLSRFNTGKLFKAAYGASQA